jgi:hypothetical protein
VTGNGSSGKGGGIHAYGTTVAQNTVTSNATNGIGGGIHAEDCTVQGNLIGGNITLGLWGNGGGLYGLSGVLQGNIVNGNVAQGKYADGGGIYAKSGDVFSNTVQANAVGGAYGDGSGVFADNAKQVLNNTIVHNDSNVNATGGLVIDYDDYGEPHVHGNTLYGHAPYDLMVANTDDISGTLNYWGTQDPVEIGAHIYDQLDDAALGRFVVYPALDALGDSAPPPAPGNVTADFGEEIVDLTWDAVPGAGAPFGYIIYYDSDGPLPPLEGTGLDQGNSGIDVGAVTSATLTGLDPARSIYFVVTFYDSQSRESWLSNPAWREGGYDVYLPAVIRQ